MSPQAALGADKSVVYFVSLKDHAVTNFVLENTETGLGVVGQNTECAANEQL